MNTKKQEEQDIFNTFLNENTTLKDEFNIYIDNLITTFKDNVNLFK